MTTTPREYEPLSVEQLGALHADLHPSRVSKRTGGGGSQLSYMEAYDVKAMLIRVFGYAGFSADVTESQIVQIIPGPEDDPKYMTVLAKATVRITVHQTGATYTETAASSQAGRQGVGEVADFALKTAESDALKRAAIYLGSQFGLSLYRNGQTADIVRRVFAPGQSRATQLIVEARDEANPEMAQAAVKRLQRMQERLKVHEKKPEQPTEPQAAPEPQEAAQEAPTGLPNPAAQQARRTDSSNPYAEQDGEARPEPAPAPARKKAPARKMNAARKALAEAEVASGLKDKPEPYDGRDPATDGAER